MMEKTKFKGHGIIVFGDSFELLGKINKKVDMVLTDPPFCCLNASGYESEKWDVEIDVDSLISNLINMVKDESAICIFAQDKFCHKISMSGKDFYKYEMFWLKNSTSSFVNCKYMPLKYVEQICVFSKSNIRNMNYHPCVISKGVKKKPEKQTIES